ncbi:MAG: hypothetical protein CMJ48_00380, partial [Planctomycetaceae bacterium]|nr:hypothetical protein [Planctomycetaceae bacterium]
MAESKRRIVIVGAGPIGIEAALFALQAGFDVQVFEKHDVAANVADWGHVELFTPFSMNASPWGRAALSASSPDATIPDADELLTGREFLKRYLLPLSRLPVLHDRIHVRTEVLAIGRAHNRKSHAIGQPARAEHPFQLLLCDERGQRTLEADVVFDCSGTYPHHNWVGAGGIPCGGESVCLNASDYRCADVLGNDRARFVGRRTLVVGAGHSAATTVVQLEQLATSEPGTSVVWLTHQQNDRPLKRLENDPLETRDALVRSANDLAEHSPNVEWLSGGQVREIRRTADAFEVSLETPNGQDAVPHRLVVDRVVANVGYRPHNALYEELQVHQCYATEGPIKLAAALLGQSPVDGLIRSGQGAETLVNPEQDFFILGAKSYGRNSQFLLAAGFEQIRELFELLVESGDDSRLKGCSEEDGAGGAMAARVVPVVDLQRMDELWFQVAGTQCNLKCTHCFISCHPKNDAFGNLTLAQVKDRLDESRALDVKEYYFTGGEPFLNREIVPILETASQYGPVTVLTNATVLKREWVERLAAAREASGLQLEFRVSIDGPNAAMNDAIRGPRAFDRAVQGVALLVEHGFQPIITMIKTWDAADEVRILSEFRETLHVVGYTHPRLKLMPRLQIGAEAERTEGYAPQERVTPAMMQGYDASQLLCTHSRIVTDRGVAVCPILIETPGAHFGPTLA